MRFLKFLPVLAGLIILYSSCKKDSNSVDFTPNFYFINGGSSSAVKNLVLFNSSDTVTFNLVISSTYVPSKSTIVTLEVADEYRDLYNTTKGTAYKAMPSGAFDFQTSYTTGTTDIYDTIPVTLHKSLLLNENYMLPIKIVSLTVKEYKIDSASSVIYLNTNANKLAGLYNTDGKRVLYVGNASDNVVSETDTFKIAKSVIPVTADTAQLDYADLGANGWKYILSYGVNSFTVLPNDIVLNSIQPGTFQVLDADLDPVTKNMHLKTSYKNLSGNERIVEESLTLQ